MQRPSILALVVGTPLAVGLVSALFFWWVTTPPAIPDVPPPAPVAAVAQPSAPVEIAPPPVASAPPPAAPEVATSAPGQPMLNPIPTLDPTPVDATDAQKPADTTAGAYVPPSRGLASEPLPE